jgi:hypothetical protein
MTAALEIAIKFGPLGGDSVGVSRSGVQWLCEDGHICQPNEVIAYCNISVEASGRRGNAPFADERALQVALASRVAGRLRIPAGSSAGGYLDVLGVHAWDKDETFAFVEPTSSSDGVDFVARVMVLAGRRMSWAVDVDTGLLPGWHSRARGWWGDGPDMPTLLCAGICDASGAVRGDKSGFVEMFEDASIPAQMIHISEHPIAPCATVLLEQFLRTPAQQEAIAADMRQSLEHGTATPDDWVFFGALSTQLGRSPIRDGHDLLTTRGLEKSKPANAILMSLAAEPRSILRHRKLGYHLNILAHNYRAAGPVVRAWIDSAFVPIARSLDDIRRDYIRLFETVGAATGARFLILNRMSTSGREDISSYMAFDAPLGDTLSSVAAKEMNLMLDGLAEAYDVAVIDVDALGAEIGGGEHLPDGIHQSGLMQAMVRAEILNNLASG